jgi:hypothetical protein
MASTGNSELYNAMLLVAKFENKLGRLQLSSIAGSKTLAARTLAIKK